MKREIKFRAWDEEGGMMHPPFTINEICEIRKEGGGLGAILMNFNWDQLMWLQFTGLHDKNGKEIYEGDIVQWEDTIDDGYGCGYLTTIREVVTFGGGAYNPISTMPSKYFEVIGNIYKNPELINK